MNIGLANSGNKYRFPKKKYNEDIKRFIASNIYSLKRGVYLLDAGCDSGYLSSEFIPQYKVIGVDKNYDAIKECQENYPTAKYKVADIRTLPFKDNFFDAIILNMVIEHAREPDELLSELKRVLKKEAIMIITTPNYASIPWVIIENVWFRLFERTFKPHLKEIHPSKFNSKTLYRSLSKHFKVVNINKITYGFTLTAVVSK